MVVNGSTGKEWKPTTTQDRVDVLAEVVDGVRGTATEWLRAWPTAADEGILHGSNVRLIWQTDGSAVAEVDDEPLGRIEVEISARFIEHTDATNRPSGFTRRLTWATVPAGWFVRTPKGDWVEVGNTSLQADGKQHVSLKVGGEFHVYPRDPDAEVVAKRGTLSPKARDDAMDALGEAFTTAILRDEPPGQS